MNDVSKYVSRYETCNFQWNWILMMVEWYFSPWNAQRCAHDCGSMLMQIDADAKVFTNMNEYEWMRDTNTKHKFEIHICWQFNFCWMPKPLQANPKFDSSGICVLWEFHSAFSYEFEMFRSIFFLRNHEIILFQVKTKNYTKRTRYKTAVHI